MDRLSQAKELRAQAERLEAEAVRPLPKKWKTGMRVRFIDHREWAWARGSEATVVRLGDECKNRRGDEPQVFWTEPDGGGALWWTTPDDVELVLPNA
jgi:hypothetical protein